MKYAFLYITLAASTLAVPAVAQTRIIRGFAPLAEVSIDPLLLPEKLFSMPKDDFIKAATPMGFEWTSTQKDSARSDRRNSKFLGFPVYETVIRYDGEKVKDATALFYGRGDSGDISQARYEELVQKTIGALDTLTKKKFTPRGRDTGNAVKADGVFWQTDKALYTLEYSATKENRTKGIEFRAEFIRLEITPFTGKKPIVAVSSFTRFEPRTQVKKEANGDVFIPTVPMVDQGRKGYCAVATTERVLRYYGVNTDANEIAQIANSDAGMGTNPGEMIEGLKKIQNRLRFKIQPAIEPDYKDFTKLIEDYNKIAKKQKAKEFPDPKKFYVFWSFYSEMERPILKELKTKDVAGYTKFLRLVTQNIEQGIPLAWGVQLGIVPEPNIPQGAGGHMRLIIGYNTKTNELIFSDSWGAGHEKKRMPFDDAWSITTSLLRIEPLQGGA